MGHALIDEFCRAQTLHPDFLRRCQRVFRDEVQAALDRGAAAEAENIELRAEVQALRSPAKAPAGKKPHLRVERPNIDGTDPEPAA
jgi:hypothetical protein